MLALMSACMTGMALERAAAPQLFTPTAWIKLAQPQRAGFPTSHGIQRCRRDSIADGRLITSGLRSRLRIIRLSGRAVRKTEL